VDKEQRKSFIAENKQVAVTFQNPSTLGYILFEKYLYVLNSPNVLCATSLQDEIGLWIRITWVN